MVGSVALNAYARPRASNDVDFLVSIPESRIARLGRELSHRRLHPIDARHLLDAYRDRSHVPVKPEDAEFLIDVRFVHSADDKRQVSEGTALSNGLRVPDVESVVAYKLHYGSDQDSIDARNVVEMSGSEIDERRLRSILERLGVSFHKYERLKSRRAGTYGLRRE